MLTDRWTHAQTHTDVLITILCHHQFHMTPERRGPDLNILWLSTHELGANMRKMKAMECNYNRGRDR